MIERCYTLTILETPKSVNAKGGGVGSHHMQTHKEKMRWEGLYMMEFLVAKIPKAMTHVTVHVELCFPRDTGREKENYRHPVAKPLADALKKAGYIKDDSDDIFEVGTFGFKYPEEWPYTKAQRIKSYMNVTLEASY